ncbi:MAG: ABC transporter permease [Butyricimonas paravirosa]
MFTIQCSFAFTGLWMLMWLGRPWGMVLVILRSIFMRACMAFKTLQEYLYLYIPLLTMGLMSGELSSGSIKLLYSSPVRNSQIILGKYLSMLVYGLVLIGIICVYVIYSAFVVKQLDVSMVLTGLLGVYLLICAYAAIGLFMSSITSYQVVAAMGTLAIFALLNVIKGIRQNIDFVRKLLTSCRLMAVATSLLRMICSEDLLYFLIVIVLFNAFYLRLKAIRQKTP